MKNPRFWSKVQRGPGCWEWQACLETTGYGYYRYDGRSQVAHRVSWKITNGPITNGLFVLHTCDNRKCVRPSHLFLGTKKDNTQDAIVKGRHKHGEESVHAKLTEKDVKKIKKDRRTQHVIAQEYGIVQQHVSNIKNGHKWKHIT